MAGTVEANGPRNRRLTEAERREQIVTGCVRILAREGYASATLARIADEAGVSKGLVSHYFGDRDALMEHVALSVAADLRELVASRIDPGADVPAVVEAAVLAAAALCRTHPDELGAVDQIARHLRRPDGQPRLDDSSHGSTHLAEQRLFRRGQAEGSLRGFDVAIVAVHYQGAIDAMIAHLRANPGVDGDAYAREVAAVLLRGIRA